MEGEKPRVPIAIEMKGQYKMADPRDGRPQFRRNLGRVDLE